MTWRGKRSSKFQFRHSMMQVREIARKSCVVFSFGNIIDVNRREKFIIFIKKSFLIFNIKKNHTKYYKKPNNSTSVFFPNILRHLPLVLNIETLKKINDGKKY